MSQNFNMSELEREVLMQRCIINEQSNNLSDLRKKLALYESQCIPRTVDIPTNAVMWVKDQAGYGAWIMHNNTHAREMAVFNAPDFFPDRPGPLYLHIVDV